MYLVQIFRVNPLMAFALCVCLGTILWCIVLTRRQNSRLDKMLTGLLGLIAIYQAMRVLTDAGVVHLSNLRRLDGWVNLLIASVYLIAALILKLSSVDRASTKVRLRLVEANERTLELTKIGAPAPPDPACIIFDSSPFATFASDSNNTVIYWNSAAEDLLGWKREEVIGRRLPFPGNGEIRNRRGHRIEAAVWISRTARATLTIAAGGAALRSAGLTFAYLPSKAQLALHS
jgi:PAS domain-containing protein